MTLYNKKSKEELKKLLEAEDFQRRTISFYRYVIVDDVPAFRDSLYQLFSGLNCLGRIYVAREGINAQMNVPAHHWDEFHSRIHKIPALTGVEIKEAVEDNGKSFYKLIVRIREKIVADGFPDDAFDVTNVGTHLDAIAFNHAMDKPDTIVVDMRNHYESEVGVFENAICPDADTFRDALPMVAGMLKGKEDHKILMYCTGGIRCEKASAYMKHHGFNDVNQLYGGIIQYARQVNAEAIPSKFKGKNFVFDDRLGERISDEIISNCHQCGKPADTHTNCANDACHLLFIQCAQCAQKHSGTCSDGCFQVISLPVEDQIKLRKGKVKEDTLAVYKKSRFRPRIAGAGKRN
jgi:UPF0176 protein